MLKVKVNLKMVKVNRKVKVREKAEVKAKGKERRIRAEVANGARKENGDESTAAGVNEYAGG